MKTKIHGNSKYLKILTKEFLIKEYTINRKSSVQIAKEVGCSSVTVGNYLRRNNIDTRIPNDANTVWSKILTKDFLYKEYITNKKSSCQIAKKVGCNYETIRQYLIKYNIPRRTHSKALKGKFTGKKHWNSGKFKDKNPNFKGGNTLKQHYCKEKGCDNKISYTNWLKGNCRCKSCASIKDWQNPIFREKQIKAIFRNRNLSPNKPETQLIQLLNKILFKTYKFVGDGKLIIAGFCPDFVNKENNKIIELFGCYWHKCPKCKFGKRKMQPKDIGRLKEYKKANYKTLIIWEHELKNITKVKERILEFDCE